MLMWVHIRGSVPFLQTSFFGFVLLCNLASAAVGVEFSVQTWTMLNVSTAKGNDTKKWLKSQQTTHAL